MTKTLQLETEIRNLPDDVVSHLAEMLGHEQHHSFITIMRKIPKSLSDFDALENEYKKKYTEDQIMAILNAPESLKNKRSPIQILFHEWGTSGRDRPRLRHLLLLLDNLRLRRASNWIREKCDLPLEDAMESLTIDLESKELPNLSIFGTYSDEFDNETLQLFDYKELERKTNGFTNFLGKGGFAEVYLAKNLTPYIEFAAIKKLLRIDERTCRKFGDELKSLSGVSHPNLIQLLGFSEHSNEKCLVYEFANGGTLKKKLLQRTEYWLKDRFKHLSEIAAGLKYLHVSKNLIHRDIKPENVLIHENIAKLCDFGLIRHVDSSTETKPIGTRGYFAPEMLNQTSVTMEADIYAFGVIMLESMTGLRVIDMHREFPHIEEFVRKSIGKDSDEFKEAISGGESENFELKMEILKFGLKCCDSSKSNRPKIEEIEQKLLSCVNEVQ